MLLAANCFVVAKPVPAGDCARVARRCGYSDSIHVQVPGSAFAEVALTAQGNVVVALAGRSALEAVVPGVGAFSAAAVGLVVEVAAEKGAAVPGSVAAACRAAIVVDVVAVDEYARSAAVAAVNRVGPVEADGFGSAVRAAPAAVPAAVADRHPCRDRAYCSPEPQQE